MNLDSIIAEAYGHFLQACSNELYKQIVFAHFAKDELDLTEEEIPDFIRRTETDDEDEIDSREFDRFYTWYYINYVINAPVMGAACGPEWIRVSSN